MPPTTRSRTRAAAAPSAAPGPSAIPLSMAAVQQITHDTTVDQSSPLGTSGDEGSQDAGDADVESSLTELDCADDDLDVVLERQDGHTIEAAEAPMQSPLCEARTGGETAPIPTIIEQTPATSVATDAPTSVDQSIPDPSSASGDAPPAPTPTPAPRTHPLADLDGPDDVAWNDLPEVPQHDQCLDDTFDVLGDVVLQGKLEEAGLMGSQESIKNRCQAYAVAWFKRGEAAPGTRSLTGAARRFCVNRQTVTHRLNGKPTRAEAHEHEQHLSKEQEDILATWVRILGRRGIPVTPAVLTQYASEIAMKPIGANWYKAFLDRHKDLKVVMSRPLEKCRAKALNPIVVREYFRLLIHLIQKYKIPPGNIYNMDEKGFLLGVAACESVIIDRDQKDAFSIADGNRELVTVIECVNALRQFLNPTIIWAASLIRAVWTENNHCNASFGKSPNGYTDQQLGAEWLEKDFEPQSAALNPNGDYRLLILDGHNSHCSYRFLEFAQRHKIIVLCLPSHTTHALQPCDVAIFSPLSKAWKKHISALSRDYGQIDKTNFVHHYSIVRKLALKPETIAAAFRKTGIWPLDPCAVPASHFHASKTTSTQSSQPVPTTLSPLLEEDPNSTPAARRYRFRQAIDELPELTESTTREDIIAHVQRQEALLKAALAQLEQNHAQLTLMDIENGRLRRRAFSTKSSRRQGMTFDGRARHLTADSAVEQAGFLYWKANIKDVHARGKEKLKGLKRTIAKQQRELVVAAKKARQAEARDAKAREKKAAAAARKAEKEAAKLASGRGRGRGGRAREGRGARGGRGVRGGRGAGEAGARRGGQRGGRRAPIIPDDSSEGEAFHLSDISSGSSSLSAMSTRPSTLRRPVTRNLPAAPISGPLESGVESDVVDEGVPPETESEGDGADTDTDRDEADGEDEEDEEYLIEIVDHRWRNGRIKFDVLWADYDTTEQSLTSVCNCEALDVYLSKFGVSDPYSLPQDSQ